MTRYSNDVQFNSFISNSIQDLKRERLCYVYTDEQVEIIKKEIQKNTNKNVIVKENGIGYTISLHENKPRCFKSIN